LRFRLVEEESAETVQPRLDGLDSLLDGVKELERSDVSFGNEICKTDGVITIGIGREPGESCGSHQACHGAGGAEPENFPASE
jgi:hypothetical protein